MTHFAWEGRGFILDRFDPRGELKKRSRIFPTQIGNAWFGGFFHKLEIFAFDVAQAKFAVCENLVLRVRTNHSPFAQAIYSCGPPLLCNSATSNLIDRDVVSVDDIFLPVVFDPPVEPCS